MNKQQILARLYPATTERLQEIAGILADDLRPEADIVLLLILEVLEDRMPEADFIRFCETF